MTNLQALALFTLASPLLLWAFFWLLFNRMPAYTSASSGPWYWWATAVPGALIDLYVNFTWGTVLFLQGPDINRGFLSARMDYLILHDFGWRGRLAIRIVGKLLEPYDLSVPKQHTTHGKTI